MKYILLVKPTQIIFFLLFIAGVVVARNYYHELVFFSTKILALERYFNFESIKTSPCVTSVVASTVEQFIPKDHNENIDVPSAAQLPLLSFPAVTRQPLKNNAGHKLSLYHPFRSLPSKKAPWKLRSNFLLVIMNTFHAFKAELQELNVFPNIHWFSCIFFIDY